MDALQELKNAIERLAPEDRRNLAEWIADLEHEEWERRVARDAADGRLADVLEEVDADIAEGKLRDLP